MREKPVALAEFGVTHMVGIGGAGMSVIALLLAAHSVQVSGCDRTDSPVTNLLKNAGISVEIGHDSRHVSGIDTLIISTAVREDNPDLQAARESNVRVLHRSQALAALMADKTSVAVAGTHGKTTTTALLAAALHGGGVDASVAIGARLAAGATGAHVGSAPVFIAEADESDGSFLRYQPDIAIVTNLEPDHLDYYGSADKVSAAFYSFVSGMPDNSTLIACADDAGARALAQRVPAHVRAITYGFGTEADVRISSDATHKWQITLPTNPHDSTQPGETSFTLQIPGRHNVLNATAAWIASRLLGADPRGAASGLEDFQGAQRRFQVRGSAGGVTVVDDYAHHPTEVAAVIEAARAHVRIAGSEGRVIAVLQPHLPSRTRAFAQEFADALMRADAAIVLDIFLAREDRIPGVDGSLITSHFPQNFAGNYVGDSAQLPQKLASQAKPGDLILMLGAGDIPEFSGPVLAALAGENA